MIKLFSRSTQWIVNQPLLTGLVLLVITTGAVIGHFNPELVTDLFKADPTEESSLVERSTASDDESEQQRPDVERMNLGGDAMLIVQADQIFTPDGIRAMRHIIDSLEESPLIQDVTWFDDIPLLNMFGLPKPLLPHPESSADAFLLAKEKALAHPLIKGNLLSEDCKTVVLMIDYDFLFVESDEQSITEPRRVAALAAEKFPEIPFEFFITGEVPIVTTMLETHDANNFFFQLIGYSVILLMAIILFRGLAAVFVVALALAMGVFWTLGFVNYFDMGGNPFNEVVLPVLISLVGLTDGVHLMVQIRKLRVAGEQPIDAARQGLGQVGMACALTSLTTAIGFGSLMLANHTYVQEFGFSCVIGVTLTFIAVITIIPLVSSSWIGKFVHVGHEKSLIDKNLNKISGLIDFVLPRRRWISVVAIVLTILLVGTSATLRPDERQSSQLPTRSEAAIGLNVLDEAMGGLEYGGVRINWSRKINSRSTEVMTVVGKVDQLLNAEPMLGHPMSMKSMVDSLPGDGNAEDRMSMLEILPPPLMRLFYEPEDRYASTLFRVRDLGISEYNPVFKRVHSGLEEIYSDHPEFNLYMTGEPVWRWENIYQIVIDLGVSLGTAVMIIFGVLALVYRSLRIGLISFVPNLFPLAVSGTFLVVTGQSLEIVVVCAFTVCLGIAVDDTIHFLTRYQEEKEKCDTEEEAIRNAFTGVGTALIMTTVVLVAGFSTVMFSDSRDHFIFASMGAITISAALFADLVFLPALLAQYANPKHVQESGS